MSYFGHGMSARARSLYIFPSRRSCYSYSQFMPLELRTTSAASLAPPTPAEALYNFRLLSALRSDDPGQLQKFLDEISPNAGEASEDGAKAGKLLAMAVRVAPGEPPSESRVWR